MRGLMTKDLYYKQQAAIDCTSDIVIIGGSAGGGKSYTINKIVEERLAIPYSQGVVFRRTHPQLVGSGGLVEEAKNRLLKSGSKISYNRQRLEFSDKNIKSKISYKSIPYNRDIYNHAGLQYDFIAFDEVMQFTEKQVAYLLSRLRSPNQNKAKMILSCNPDKNHGLYRLVKPYLDADGYPDSEINGCTIYVDCYQDILGGEEPLRYSLSPFTFEKSVSVTFYSFGAYDNPELIKNNPRYLSILENLCEKDRQVLLNGRWK